MQKREKTKEEVAAGKVNRTMPISEVDLDEVLLVRRFGVEQYGPRGRKVRCVDDFRTNEAKSYAVMWETVYNDCHDEITSAILCITPKMTI